MDNIATSVLPLIVSHSRFIIWLSRNIRIPRSLTNKSNIYIYKLA